MPGDPWAQQRSGARFDWGPVGAQRAGDSGGTIVAVDVLSFTTAVSVAVGRGTAVLPAATRDVGATTTDVVPVLVDGAFRRR